MGIHLVKIHGRENVVVLSADDRLIDILQKCCTDIPTATKKKLHLDNVEQFTGTDFAPSTFPVGLNLKTAKVSELEDVFGAWPLEVGDIGDVYRWERV